MAAQHMQHTSCCLLCRAGALRLRSAAARPVKLQAWPTALPTRPGQHCAQTRRAAACSTFASMSSMQAGPVDAVKRHSILAADIPTICMQIPAEARFVCIGDASHGTSEFYAGRAAMTRHLIEHRGFNAVAVEADWPDAFRANMFVRGLSDDDTAEAALGDFKRFPRWMWRNREVVDFLDWLRKHNARWPDTAEAARSRQVGFYGMDVYSLTTSMQEVVSYLREVDPTGADKVMARWRCFDSVGEDAIQYAYGLAQGRPDCAQQALATLLEVRKKASEYLERQDGSLESTERNLSALVNALCVKDAESYYRNMLFKDEITWNIRDRHMVETVRQLEAHLRRYGIKDPKIAIWAHNSHLGDARATEMGRSRGEVNIGQLMRARYGKDQVDFVVGRGSNQDAEELLLQELKWPCRQLPQQRLHEACDADLKTFLCGFTTHTGRVAAADDWGEPVKHKAVKSSMKGSYELLLHSVGAPHFALPLRGAEEDLQEAVKGPLLERFIGVIYRPDTERWSHYSKAWLESQLDMVVHVDTTSAVHPLDKGTDWEEHKDLPETFPYGL